MITSPGGRSWSSATWVNGSSASEKTPSARLMNVGIDGLLEGGDAGAPEGVEEALDALPFAQIGLHQGVYSVGHLVVRQSRTQRLADGGVFRPGAAQGELV